MEVALLMTSPCRSTLAREECQRGTGFSNPVRGLALTFVGDHTPAEAGPTFTTEKGRRLRRPFLSSFASNQGGVNAFTSFRPQVLLNGFRYVFTLPVWVSTTLMLSFVSDSPPRKTQKC
jgi:hypothetical protein